MAVSNAQFKKGEISITKEQIKKHYTQCTNEEITYLANRAKCITNIRLSKHAKEKDITINLNDVKKILKSKDLKKCIIEYNETNGDKRILIRSKEQFPTNVNNSTVYCNLCIVLSLIKNEIVTAYFNSVKDNHDNINIKRYDANLKIK